VLKKKIEKFSWSLRLMNNAALFNRRGLGEREREGANRETQKIIIKNKILSSEREN